MSAASSMPTSRRTRDRAGTDRVRRHKQFGAVAQLGERLHGMQEVSGSIPLSSTIHVRPEFVAQLAFRAA